MFLDYLPSTVYFFNIINKSMGVFGSSTTNENVVKADMASISNDLLKEYRKHHKQEDSYKLNLKFVCEGLALKTKDENDENGQNKCASDCDDEYFIVLCVTEKDIKAKAEKLRQIGHTDKVKGNNPSFNE